ncbi:MAG TPA: Uma2 family endonuclease [Nitrospirales bacterium]|nr:Uma2 family endonuclease [Nitrospirales bacterium]
MNHMSNIATVLSSEELSQVWADLAQNDQLPDWYELTEHGELIMSPKPSNRHQVICAEIAYQLRAQLGGKAVSEAAVLTTSAGIRVPDIVWMPEDKWQVVTIEEGLIRAPDFVVEVLSPGNRQVEINYKVQAYLASGIQEVLVVGLKGSLEFYRQDGIHTTSSFNVKLSLPPHLFQ